MPRRISIFDTNLYRSLSLNEISELRAAERRAGFEAVASFYTIIELCAHLADPTDRDFSHCRAAIHKLWVHTQLYDGSRKYVPITGDRDALLARSLFGKTLGNLGNAAERYGRLVGAIAHQDEAVLDEWQPVFVEIQARSEALKSSFVAQAERWTEVMSGGHARWDPLADQPERRHLFLQEIEGGRGIRLLAESLASRTAKACGISLADEELSSAADRIASRCGVALHYYNLLIRKIVETGYNLSKGSRRTAVWDYQFAFEAGAFLLPSKIPVVLVTGDRLIQEAARCAGKVDTVISPEQYRSDLKLQ